MFVTFPVGRRSGNTLPLRVNKLSILYTRFYILCLADALCSCFVLLCSHLSLTLLLSPYSSGTTKEGMALENEDFTSNESILRMRKREKEKNHTARETRKFKCSSLRSSAGIVCSTFFSALFPFRKSVNNVSRNGFGLA